jgi:uncharacterized protein (TIGR03435 family)
MAALALGPILHAQVAPSTPAFEVASVKSYGGALIGRAIRHVPAEGQVLLTNRSLLALINYAFDVKNRYGLDGAPEWIAKESFEVRATPPPGASAEQVPRMLQQLLADRFGLRVRREMRKQPVYALVVARSDGRLGPGLTPSTHDCPAFFATGATVGSPALPRDEHGSPACGAAISLPLPTGLSLTLLGNTMPEFARKVVTWGGAAAVDRELLDRTGLSGAFDARIEFASAVLTTTANSELPSFRQALEEQLGLKLEARREVRPVLVIESVSRPSPD